MIYMKKGFTLVELLAVIVIIAVIALITTPIVLGAIQDAKENALKDTAHGLVTAAGTYQAEMQGLNKNSALTINYKTSSAEQKSLLKTKGKLPDAGELKIDNNGKVTFALWSDDAKVCVVKETNAKEIKVNENIKNAESCIIANINK